ncbi:acetyltransferase [Mumia zhuanghuii]|uniref:Lysine N-acyltransferase MbtK n=2 Tax=Mumia TaxID=1546255 RepID=A0ABW1QM22_9ACTN|nr:MULTISPECIES: GNAT family N-acetyltransferase [Mumia]KAA1419780.1 acetyltransferase [Mumia zhuanghuii]
MTVRLQDRLRTGAPGAVLRHDEIPGFGTVTVRVLDPVADLETLHRWVTQPRGRFWGLAELDRDELRDLYAYVDGLETHHAFLLCRDDEPFALLQTYAPEHDPVGECYEPRAGDVGLHFFLGEQVADRETQWAVLVRTIVGFVLGPPGARRIVVEPDVGNARATAMLDGLGFEIGPEIALPDKTARLAFLDDARAKSLEAAVCRVLGAASDH